MTTEAPVIISYKLCPYVFRAVSTMHYKKLNYPITFIDLSNKPDWFKKISPLGKVPILKIGNQGIQPNNLKFSSF
jgi:glutathione S-transferase